MGESAWKDNAIQFPRLLSEIYAVGLTEHQVRDLIASMGITREELYELLKRADREFEKLKHR